MKTYKGTVIYSYRMTKRNIKRFCVANPNHNYPYTAIGITMASGFKSEYEAINYVDTHYPNGI